MDELREENIVIKGNISFDKSDPIGRNVFRGTFNDKKVAVKRIWVENQHLDTREDLLKRLQDSQNVVKLYEVTFDNDFRYERVPSSASHAMN